MDQVRVEPGFQLAASLEKGRSSWDLNSWPTDAGALFALPRKEVIQPQLPLRLPCYDFVPITRPTLGRCLLAVGPRTSSVTSFHDVTGGVYKAREHIHRTVLTCGY
jgi:hypothetical protein